MPPIPPFSNPGIPPFRHHLTAIIINTTHHSLPHLIRVPPLITLYALLNFTMKTEILGMLRNHTGALIGLVGSGGFTYAYRLFDRGQREKERREQKTAINEKVKRFGVYEEAIRQEGIKERRHREERIIGKDKESVMAELDKALTPFGRTTLTSIPATGGISRHVCPVAQIATASIGTIGVSRHKIPPYILLCESLATNLMSNSSPSSAKVRPHPLRHLLDLLMLSKISLAFILKIVIECRNYPAVIVNLSGSNRENILGRWPRVAMCHTMVGFYRNLIAGVNKRSNWKP
ncbi:hypothetical protein B9Z19DRAFT_1066000 [Tuber borchii]|uniref:Uncharacterized protein n=1 Tax=Tuber borchii TaxID=42251 RepID=A0A2T6ZP64_TUBBO|nr:hypothetical protein B9Z19DRAFT_1066000 [Tuber borchii]